MTGRSVVPILEEHGDVYITGSTVVRHKVEADGNEADVFPTWGDTQLVLSTRHVYKLRQRFPPKPTKKYHIAKWNDGSGLASNAGFQDLQQQRLTKENDGRDVVFQVPRPELIWQENLGMIYSVVPLYNHASRAWAAKRGEPSFNCNGFAIAHFSPHKNGPKPQSQRTVLQRYMRECCRCVGDVFGDFVLTTANGGCGGLRVREFHVGLFRPPRIQGQQQNLEVVRLNALHGVNEGSRFLQQDWCYAFSAALMNYWHERLEAHLIEEPEIFQYQVYAMEFSTSDMKFADIRQHRQKPLLCQLVLSTERLYVVPRHNVKLLSVELPLQHAEMCSRWFTVSALQSILFDSDLGIIHCVGQQERCDTRSDSLLSAVSFAVVPSKTVTLTLGFFSVSKAEEALVEIRRVWELTHCNLDFPLTITGRDKW